MTETPHLQNEPRSVKEDARFAVRDMLREFEVRKGEILSSARSFTVASTRAIAADITDVVGIAKSVGDRIQARRDELAQPYREAGATIRTQVEEFWADVAAEIARLTDLVDDYLESEKERIRRQQEEQAAEQAAMRQRAGASEPAPALAPAPPKPLRGSYGARATAATRLEIVVTDVTKVPLDILNAPKVLEAIVAVARDFAKHRDEIPGLAISRGSKLSIRSA